MKRYTRRNFLKLSGPGSVCFFAASDHAQIRGAYQIVLSAERDRILRSATRYLDAKPVTITSARSERSAGGLHDYFSEGDYWWPDPKNPGGPYIRRDGYSNPSNFTAHREAIIRLGQIVPTLTAAWVLTRQSKFSNHAERHLRAWFVDPATKMNPNLEFAQAIFGLSKGRGIGIIDTIHLVEVARSVSLFAAASELNISREIMHWFAEYLVWMLTSANGQEERDQANNHGTCWLLQVAEFARLVGDEKTIQWCRERFSTTIVPNQIAPDGSLPLELARTKPYSYSLFDMDILCACAQSLSSRQYSLWTYVTTDGRSLKKMMAFIVPFIEDKSKWPYPHDVEHWNDLPVRNAALLFGGIAYTQPSYLELWKRLDAEPTDPEIVRNFPIRQPLLWI